MSSSTIDNAEAEAVADTAIVMPSASNVQLLANAEEIAGGAALGAALVVAAAKQKKLGCCTGPILRVEAWFKLHEDQQDVTVRVVAVVADPLGCAVPRLVRRP